MNTRLMKQFEQQFGENWVCTCRTPLDPNRFEILSENHNSVLVHYICPVCGKEQMLAASIGSEVSRSANAGIISTEAKKFLKMPALSSDDVLDIMTELKRFKNRDLRALSSNPLKGSKIKIANVKWKN